jgi:acyl-coenzyme A synthetase/AMP-(fatty) acid ligase
MHGHAAIPACIATYGRRVLRLRPGDVTWSTAALSSSYGLGNTCYFPLGAGAAAWVETAPRSPAAAARACAEGGVTAVFGVPTGWARLARHVAEGRVPREAFARVRLAVSAGEALDPRVWRAVEGATGLRLVNALGASETTNLYLSDRPGGPTWGTVGHPVPGYEVRLAPHPSAPEGAGELLVRGPTVTRGYLGDPGATDRALTPDGWLRTGDLARRRPDGGHEFLGRAGDRFKVGGLWVDPAAVRAAILADDAVADAVVLPVPDPAGVPRLAAAVAPRPGRAAGLAARVRGGLAGRLQAHEVPRVIVVEPELPVTGSGKADRTAVAARAAAALSAGGDQEVA